MSDSITFSGFEMRAIKLLVAHARKHCGGGEDVPGALLYTGAGRFMTGEELVALAEKLEPDEDD